MPVRRDTGGWGTTDWVLAEARGKNSRGEGASTRASGISLFQEREEVAERRYRSQSRWSGGCGDRQPVLRYYTRGSLRHLGEGMGLQSKCF